MHVAARCSRNKRGQPMETIVFNAHFISVWATRVSIRAMGISKRFGRRRPATRERCAPVRGAPRSAEANGPPAVEPAAGGAG